MFCPNALTVCPNPLTIFLNALTISSNTLTDYSYDLMVGPSNVWFLLESGLWLLFQAPAIQARKSL